MSTLAPAERNTTPASVPGFLCKHYSVDELAAKWGLSRQTVTGYFENEPGVMVISATRQRFVKGRGRVTLRIPESVAERVYKRVVIPK